MGTYQVEFCSQMSIAVSCHVLVDAHVCLDVKGRDMPQHCVQQVDRFGGGRIMVRAGIHHGGRTALVRVAGDRISRHYAAPRHSAHEYQQ